MGPYSSYTHQATRSVFPEENFDLSPTVTIKEIFDVVQSSGTDLGVVPFENSTHGPVLFTLDALSDRQSLYQDLTVVGEIYLDVHHCLVGRPSSSTPSSTQQPQPSHGVPLPPLTHIKRVYSHPQAFGQTQAFFSKYLKGVETLETSSTSKAAQLAAEDETGTSAAVASALSATTNNLAILASNIEDRDDNTTRFLIIARQPTTASTDSLPTSVQDTKIKPLKSLVSFTVPHRSPGALSNVLDVFKRHGLNLTSINTTPSRTRPFQYMFFVEFSGSLDDGEEVEKELWEATESFRLWGCWVNQRD